MSDQWAFVTKQIWEIRRVSCSFFLGTLTYCEGDDGGSGAHNLDHDEDDESLEDESADPKYLCSCCCCSL